jgi:hypothetical protein
MTVPTLSQVATTQDTRKKHEKNDDDEKMWRLEREAPNLNKNHSLTASSDALAHGALDHVSQHSIT